MGCEFLIDMSYVLPETLQNYGEISARGKNSHDLSMAGGGGAGGSIYITVTAIYEILKKFLCIFQ